MKRGQMQISFGMIFSIILIIAFLALAFYGIKTFLELQNKAKIADFKDKFQADVSEAWSSSIYSDASEYSLPGKIDAVCITDSSENVFLKPETAYPSLSFITIDHIDTFNLPKDPYCIEKIDGKISVLIKKDSGDNLVTIKAR